MARSSASGPLPGGKGVKMLTGLPGKSLCANAGAAAQKAVAASRARVVRR